LAAAYYRGAPRQERRCRCASVNPFTFVFVFVVVSEVEVYLVDCFDVLIHRRVVVVMVTAGPCTLKAGRRLALFTNFYLRSVAFEARMRRVLLEVRA
jgi:hypothetical protein